MSINQTSTTITLLFQDALSEPQHTLLDATHSRAFLAKYLRMQTAIETIASMERLTFAECSDAETIMSAAKDALLFDPLSVSSSPSQDD